MQEESLRARFPQTFALLDECEASTKPYNPRKTIPGIGLDSWFDPETGVTIDWDPLFGAISSKGT